jgi:alpha-beta hydrolase superfamily lysophospholipase
MRDETSKESRRRKAESGQASASLDSQLSTLNFQPSGSRLSKEETSSGRHAVERFAASDGYQLHYRHWPAAGPRGYVVALHGIQSHSGWYTYSSLRLADAGFDVRFLDRRGSGLNETDRGHAVHQDRLVNDVAQFLSCVRHERHELAPQAPVVLLGLSWGGKLAAVVAGRRPELCDGLALLYPGLKPRIRPSPWQRLLLKLAMRAGKQRRLAPIPLDDPELFTAQADWQRFIRDDELALHEASVSFLAASVALDAELPRRVADVRCPALLMLAGRDRIIDNDATRALFDRFGSTDLGLLVYPDAAHTLEFEPDRERIFGELIDWLNGRRRA